MLYRFVFAAFVCLAPALAAPAAIAAELEAQQDGLIRILDIATPPFAAATTIASPWETEVQRTGAQYLRLHISGVEGSAAAGSQLKLRDRNGRVIRTYQASEMRSRGAFWTALIPGDYVLVTLLEPTPGFRFKIDAMAFQAFGGAALSTVGDDEKQPIADYANDPLISRLERPIAKLVFVAGGASRTCTGFLIDSGQLMTNQHCVSTAEVCASALAIFGYEYDPNGELSFGEQFECAGLAAGKANAELDFSVLDLRGNPAATFGKLELAAIDPASHGALMIIQHPAGEPKQISKTNCAADRIPVDGRTSESDFTHSCDTVGGSSGSPVFDDSGKVVGLHHYGFAEGGDWSENRAVRMKLILEDINAR